MGRGTFFFSPDEYLLTFNEFKDCHFRGCVSGLMHRSVDFVIRTSVVRILHVTVRNIIPFIDC